MAQLGEVHKIGWLNPIVEFGFQYLLVFLSAKLGAVNAVVFLKVLNRRFNILKVVIVHLLVTTQTAKVKVLFLQVVVTCNFEYAINKSR